jgi:hypothetical protein
MNFSRLTRRQRDRFWSNVDARGFDECWLWTGGKDKDGYGKVGFDYKHYRAHRVSYALSRDGIDPSLLVCHTCDTPSCVNPKHLFQGTVLINNRDRDAKGRNGRSLLTHCPQGHLYDEENTYRWGGDGHRQCLTCRRIRGNK